MADSVRGVLLTGRELHYTLRAFEVLLRDRRPSPQLADHLARLQRAYAESCAQHESSCDGARLNGTDTEPGAWSAGDVLDTDEAAAVLGIGSAGVRDLCRRGRLPAVRAGGRWLLSAPAVVARAEHRAR